LILLANNGAPGRIDSSVTFVPSSPLRGALKRVQNASPRFALFASHFVEPLSVRTLPGQIYQCFIFIIGVIFVFEILPKMARPEGLIRQSLSFLPHRFAAR
jgi:hypothetical protein